MSTIKSRNFLRVIFLLALLSPSLTFAITQSTAGFENLNDLILTFANKVVRSTGYMMFTLAVVAFFWGIVQFIWAARQGSEGKGIQKGTQFIKWGLIAIFVMFSVWGIIKFAQDVFQIRGDNTIIVPSLEFIRRGSSLTETVSSCNPPEVWNGTGCVPVGTITQAHADQLLQTCLNAGGSTATKANCQNAVKAALANATAGAVVNTQAKADQLYQTCVTNGGQNTDCMNAAQAALNNNLRGNGLKSDGSSCSGSTECSSGFCNSGNVCESVSAANKLQNGIDCYQDQQCDSNYCSMNGVCENNPSGSGSASSGLGDGAACSNSGQCQNGLTCVGTLSEGKTCKALDSNTGTGATTGAITNLASCKAAGIPESDCPTSDSQNNTSSGGADSTSGYSNINTGYSYDTTTGSAGSTDRNVNSLDITRPCDLVDSYSGETLGIGIYAADGSCQAP